MEDQVVDYGRKRETSVSKLIMDASITQKTSGIWKRRKGRNRGALCDLWIGASLLSERRVELRRKKIMV